MEFINTEIVKIKPSTVDMMLATVHISFTPMEMKLRKDITTDERAAIQIRLFFTPCCTKHD